MNDDDRLRDKLAKLSEATADADKMGRELHAGDFGGWMVVILDEIDETILARKLTFETNVGNIVELDVANRRLHCLSGLSGGITVPPHTELLKKALTDGDDRLVQAIGTALKEMVNETEQIWVRSSPLGRELGPTELGVSARNLGKAWSLDQFRSQAIPPGEVMQKIVGACAKIAVAVVQLKNATVVEKKGEGAGIEQLLELVAIDRSNLRAKLDRCFGGQQVPAGLVIGSDQKSPNTIAMAFAGPHEALLIVPTDKIQDLYRAWHSIHKE